MPEGPEIRRAADRISKVLADKVVEDALFGQPQLREQNRQIIGSRVTLVTSKGKALLTHFDNNKVLYTHNQLYGRWYVKRRNQLPRTNRTLRVALHTETHSALLYSASDIHLLDAHSYMEHPYLAKLGPDALDENVHWRDILHQLTSPKFYRRSLASLYLDQGFVAGIGNYLRSEILFEAGLHPALKPNQLTRAQLGKLARATLNITRQAYATAGVTNKSKRVARLQREGATRSKYRFAVFARQNQPCYTCGQPVIRSELNSRRIYLCESCQPESGAI